MKHLRLPSGTGRSAMAAAALAWCGSLAGWAWGVPALIVCGAAGLAAAAKGRAVAGALLIGAVASGWAAASRVDTTLSASIAEGPRVFMGVVADEPTRSFGALRFVFRPQYQRSLSGWERVSIPPLAVSPADGQYVPVAGDLVVVKGAVRSSPGRIRGDPVAGRMSGAAVDQVSSSANPLFRVGNVLRRRVAARLAGADSSGAAALLSGFLIGDTSGMSAADTEALRRAGLSHFVAVSGSNVALFLAGWWLLSAPIARRPKVRAATGLVALAVFVVLTRWEPSVVRAAVMAGIVLVGRLLGFPIDTWVALGSAVAALLLLSGDLAASVGFQLSVFATAGVLAGAGLFAGRRPRWAWTALAATLSAQAAVTPLLLIHFGRVPLLSPVANLAAAPLVTLSTMLGGAGIALGVGVPIGPALWAADGVLAVARRAAAWPQLDAFAVAGVVALGLLLKWRRVRPVVIVASAVGIVVVASPPGAPAVPTLTVMDVGQGDAVMLRDGTGTTVLVDGGRDPRVLIDALRRHGVHSIDLLVVTHGDSDHAGGIEGLASAVPIGRIWVPDQPDLGPVLPRILEEAGDRGIPIERIRAGPVIRAGEFSIAVLGPMRRYASMNDGSIVLWVEVAAASVLLPGDIERIAQGELPPVEPDVMLVPHHGSATTDLDWLEKSVGRDVIVSVGENSYGHPAPSVMDALLESGARVWVTAEVGDVTVPLR